MARRRMIGLSVFESDAFLDLPAEAKALYPYIILKADDEGLLSNMKALLRTFGSAPEHLECLIETGFILGLGKGIFAVAHWEQQNHIAPSKKTSTLFTEEAKRLRRHANGTYSL